VCGGAGRGAAAGGGAAGGELVCSGGAYCGDGDCVGELADMTCSACGCSVCGLAEVELSLHTGSERRRDDDAAAVDDVRASVRWDVTCGGVCG
jgi:hypothetical protein